MSDGDGEGPAGQGHAPPPRRAVHTRGRCRGGRPPAGALPLPRGRGGVRGAGAAARPDGPGRLPASAAPRPHGFSDALGDSLPLRDRQGPLVLVSALSWLCGYTTTDICLRSRLAAVPLIPPIVLLGLSLPLTAPIGGPSVVYISIFVALCLGQNHGVQGTDGHAGDLAEIAAAVSDEMVDRACLERSF